MLRLRSRHRIMCGDSKNEDDIDKLMDGAKADMVFTDPPYGIKAVRKCGSVGSEPHKSHKAKSKIYKQIEGDSEDFDCNFILNLSDNVFIFGGNYFAHNLPRSTHWIVWNKHVNNDLERRFNTSDCELIWTSLDQVKTVQYTHGWAGMLRSGSKKEELKDRVHPTQKPVGLIENILTDYKYEIVLDLFLGSGSTLIACEKSNRQCYGMEIDPHYCSVIIKRFEEYSGDKAVLYA